MGKIKYLLIDRAIFIADNIGCAVELRRSNTGRPCSYRIDPGCAAQCGTRDRHQTDRADTDNEHGISVLNIGKLRSMETGRNHVRKHRRMFDFYAVGDMGKIAVRIIDMEVFAEYPVFKV